MRAALRPCPMPGCPNLTDQPKGCRAHRAMAQPLYAAPEWRAVAAAYLAAHPRCEQCRHRRATGVHHRVALAVAPHRLLDPTNLMALCAPCHRQVTPTAHDTGTYPRRRP